MEVNWDRLDPRLQCVDGLDDIMRFDLQHFCRRMQPPHEPHYRSALHHFIAFIQCCDIPSMWTTVAFTDWSPASIGDEQHSSQVSMLLNILKMLVWNQGERCPGAIVKQVARPNCARSAGFVQMAEGASMLSRCNVQGCTI